MVRLAHIGSKGEDRSGRLGTKDDGREAEEELEHAVLQLGDQSTSVPETKSKGQEEERLRGSIQQTGLEDGDQTGSLLSSKRGLVLLENVRLTCERGNSSNGRDGLGRKGGRLLVGSLGATLEVRKHVEPEEAAAQQDGNRRDTDQGQLPADGQGKNQGRDQSRGDQEQCTQSNTADTCHVRGLGREERGESAGSVLVSIEECNILSKHASESTVPDTVDQSLGTSGKGETLQDVGNELNPGKHQVHGAPEVAVFLDLMFVGWSQVDTESLGLMLAMMEEQTGT